MENNKVTTIQQRKHEQHLKKLEKITIADYSLKVKDFINSPLIRSYDLHDIAPIVGAVIRKANIAYSGQQTMSMDEVAALSYDLIELMSYDRGEEIALMFKMFRQGKLTQDTFKPFKKFDGFNVMNVLVPTYWDEIQKEKEKIKKEEDKKNWAMGAEHDKKVISALKIPEDTISRFTLKEYIQEEVTDAFKVAVNVKSLEEKQMFLESLRVYPTLEDKRSYVAQSINEDLNKQAKG